MDFLHIYRADNERRTRRTCPYHKKSEYGNLQEYYDTVRVFFDCGTLADYGYGFYRIPQAVQREQWRATKRRQRARRSTA